MKEIKTVIQEITDAQNADPFNAEATTDALTDALELLEEFGKIVQCKDCFYWNPETPKCKRNGSDRSANEYCSEGIRNIKWDGN